MDIEQSKDSIFDFKKFEALLSDICIIDPKIDKVLHKYTGTKQKQNIDCEFLLIKSTEKYVREEDFIKLLLGAIVRYTLRYIRRHPSSRNPTPKELESFYEQNMVALVHQAKGLFMDNLTEKTSEFGELFLFMLLESRGIVQLLNKMNLKTNAQMPIHGLDAIHIGVKNNTVTIYYGYSKVYERHSDAIRDAVKEIKTFSNDEKRKEREFDLITDYIDRDKFQDFSDKVIELISPYAEDKKFVSEAHSLFLGYHWPILDKPVNLETGKLDDFLAGEYKKKVIVMERKIQDKIATLPQIDNYSFIVWTLPLSNLKDFREKFVQRLDGL